MADHDVGGHSIQLFLLSSQQSTILMIMLVEIYLATFLIYSNQKCPMNTAIMNDEKQQVLLKNVYLV